MGEQVNRYELRGSSGYRMGPDEDGSWVLYKDYAALEDERDEALALAGRLKARGFQDLHDENEQLRAKLAALMEAAHWAVRDSLRGCNARGGMVRTDTIKQLRQALDAAKEAQSTSTGTGSEQDAP